MTSGQNQSKHSNIRLAVELESSYESYCSATSVKIMPYYVILTPAIPHDPRIRRLIVFVAEVMRVLVLQKKLLQRQDAGPRDGPKEAQKGSPKQGLKANRCR